MQIKRKWVLLLLCLSMVLCTSGCAWNGNRNTGSGTDEIQSKTIEIFAMDTIMDLTVYAKEPEPILTQAQQMIFQYEQLFSVNIERSDVAKLNQGQGQPVQVSGETYELIQKSIDVSERTEGLFDISIYPLVRAWGFTTQENRVPAEAERKSILGRVDYRKIQLGKNDTVTIPKGMQIDLGGIAKGYLSQKLIEMFRQSDAVAGVVSLGGNVQTYGKKPDGSPFTVGITDPKDGTSVFGTMQIGEKAVVTSGAYQRYFEKDGKTYHHLMDKRTGAPAESDLKSVTVISEDGTSADSLATALFVMGKKKAIQFEKENKDIQLILIDDKGEVWTSEGIELKR